MLKLPILIELTAAFLRDEPVTLRPDIDYHKLCGIAKRII